MQRITVVALAASLLVTTPAQAIWIASGRGYAPGAIPGTIQAEDFDRYSDTTATNDGGSGYRSSAVDITNTPDAGGGYYVGWIRYGEWLEYDVNIAVGGSYIFSARVASINSGKTFHLEVDRYNVSGLLFVPYTGAWGKYATVTTRVTLPAGRHTLRISMDSSSFDINYFSLFCE
jgi:hypothetical protein